MMVGYCLKQILHLQREFERYTDFYWDLIATLTYDKIKDRCIDNVAIRHSFVVRKLQKVTQFVSNYFLLYKV